MNGVYYITIDAFENRCWFGEVVNGEMILNVFGKIVEEEWLKSFQMRKELFLDCWVIMPNHLHAIVKIDSPFGDVVFHDENNCKSVVKKNQPMRAKQSISSFIAGFKSATTCRIDDYIDLYDLSLPKFNRRNKLWHHNYYDVIIKSEEELYQKRRYIDENPQKWREDQYLPEIIE
jgi:REP element-mobilizing transposase RayT